MIGFILYQTLNQCITMSLTLNYCGRTWSQVQIFSAVASYKKQTPWFNELIIVTHNLADDCGLPEH